jgi:drug/metabolite transporter (DMT)-like permease
LSAYLAAALAVLIWAGYPVATRAGLTGSFAPDELIALRFGVAALVFLPYLALHGRAIERAAWLRGVPRMLFQGAGMGALVICGLQFAPANHQAALGPGVNAAWVSLLGFLLFARLPSSRALLGATLCALGVLLLTCWSAAALDARVLAGDFMFLAASALGALYLLQLRSWRVSAIQGAAIVSVYSACVAVPYLLLYSAPGSLARHAAGDIVWQVFWQGVLIGVVSLVALNHAIARLGAERASALLALVPVLSALLALAFLGEVPSRAEAAAFLIISTGVWIGAGRALRRQPSADQRADEALALRRAVPRVAAAQHRAGQLGLEVAQPADRLARLVQPPG